MVQCWICAFMYLLMSCICVFVTSVQMDVCCSGLIGAKPDGTCSPGELLVVWYGWSLCSCNCNTCAYRTDISPERQYFFTIIFFYHVLMTRYFSPTLYVYRDSGSIFSAYIWKYLINKFDNNQLVKVQIFSYYSNARSTWITVS